MHPFLFTMKRAFHASAGFARRVLRPVGITPARFDVMALIEKEDGAIEQSRLTRALGVTRSVVSRMLDRMTELGLVQRVKHEKDRRQRVVLMTEKGWEVFVSACERFPTDLAEEALAALLTPRSWRDDVKVQEAIRRVERPLFKLRRAFGDRGPRRLWEVPSGVFGMRSWERW
jgi:MarR family transcriptional regulator for hemolysin